MRSVKAGVPQRATAHLPEARVRGHSARYELVPRRCRFPISRPIRSFADARAFAPVAVPQALARGRRICASRPQPLDEYVESIGDADRVINMLVGDTQRITVYAERGYAITQPVPAAVANAYERLLSAGYRDRIIAPERP